MTAVSPGAVAAGTMTAVVQDEYGTAPEAVLRLAEITRPAIAADEILVRVRAASVDRGTWHLMAGPAVPHAAGGLRAPQAQGPQPGPQPGRDGRVRRPGGDRVQTGR
jgi:NADPH:quinone reductase-like Zn-dependent oxidoreductase